MRNKDKSWRQVVNRATPFVGSLAGMIIILVTVISVAESVNTIAMVTLGILVLELGIWYGANPIFTNARQNHALRDELDRFVDLVRQLNRVATTSHTEDEIEGVNAEMHVSVDAMVRMAGDTARDQAGAKASARDASGSEPKKQATT